MDNTIPGVTSIVDNDMDLAVAEFGSLLDQVLDVLSVHDIAGYSDSLASRLVDVVGDIA